MYTQMRNILNNKWTLPAVVGATSFVLGAAGGYYYGRKKILDAFIEELELEKKVQDNQLAFDFDTEELAPVTDLDTWKMQNSNHPSLQEYSYMDDLEGVDEFSEFELEWDAELAIEEDELEDAEEINNVFAGTDEEWDYDKEINSRGTDPYVIHVDEFVANELGFDQHTYTYYVTDDILADENDVPVYNYSNVIGDLKFGHGSKDPSLVYIRNENTRTEYEIIKHSGSFEVEVRGLEIESQYESQEIRHARSPQRFRME